MPPRAVLDSTVLVSAMLNPKPGGASYDLLRFAENFAFELCLSIDILEETTRVLTTHERIRRRYPYSDADIAEYRRDLESIATIIDNPPLLKVVRDPNDDMIVACAVAAAADYLVSRDDDLLSLSKYGGVEIVTPEEFLRVLRERE
jgi:putative PIN family toxin of toxin-antitoxin system